MDLLKYKQIVESELFCIGPVVAFIWENSPLWPVKAISSNILTLYGYTQEEFLEATLKYAEVIVEEDRQRVFDEVLEATSSLQNSFTHEPYRVMTKEGNIRWVQDTTVILRENGEVTHFIGYIQDITRLKNLENEKSIQNSILLKHEALFKGYQLIMDESSMVSKANLAGKITFVNDKFCEVSGYEREEILGKSHGILRSDNTSDETVKDLWNTITSKRVWKGVLKNRGKRSYYWVDITILPLLDEYENITEYIAVRHEITQMIEQSHKLDAIANTDMLTGYGNRYKLMRDIELSLNPALAIVNIDDFSQINDFYGHEKGDKVIARFGEMLYGIILRGNGELYHLQGDEFVILESNSNHEDFVEEIKEVIEELRVTPVEIKGEDYFMNATASISFETKERLLSTADMALKIAKKENKSLLIYSDAISLDAEYENNLKWRRELKDAIEQDRILPLFQPIVDNQTQAFSKYESLVRLQSLDGKLVSPFFFLEISKKTKHYASITKIMLKKSFETFRDKTQEFSVNLTIADILNLSIKNYIFELLELYGIGERVVFEIVESESIENFAEIAAFIASVKSFGAKIAIDDFGTGYSNFEYLLRLKADYIKIDGSMIRNIDSDGDAQIVVSTIVDFAKKMGVKTIAEFVENESIYNKVKELGIDYSQGYYFSEPKLAPL